MEQKGMVIFEGRDAPLMAKRTTLRLGGPVLGEIILTDSELAHELPGIAARLGGQLVCLGAGSNILAGDGLLPLVTVRNTAPGTVEVIEDASETIVVRVGGATKLPLLLARLAELDFGGLEGLSGIPGTVGGAVSMNAGSYGQCVADSLVSLEVVTERGEVTRFDKSCVDFAYRHMELPGLDGWWMILSADFCLTRSEQGAVKSRGREVVARKQASQPVTAASAGCVFKNPDTEIPAGRLLEEAGFRGKRLGGMVFSSMHANFLVNEGSGTSAEALELIHLAKEAVLSRHGFCLETEVRIWT